jgi:spore coat polysaccharide biosynthesis protein SpsF
VKPRIVAIVQARMGSARLPGKVLMDIAGATMLDRVVERTSRSALLDEVLVATTTERIDDKLSDYCSKRAWRCFRGSQFDVLDRYFQSARAAKADIIVRVTADCPLIDSRLLDEVIRKLLSGDAPAAPDVTPAADTAYDFAANRLPPPWKRTYPIGLDVEVCTYGSLQRAWTEAEEPQQREHVMPYMYEGVELKALPSGMLTGTSPRGFRVAVLQWPTDFGDYRWTVDTVEDLEFVRGVYGRLGGARDFGWNDVLSLVQSDPHLRKINAAIKHKGLSDVDERAAGRRLP